MSYQKFYVTNQSVFFATKAPSNKVSQRKFLLFLCLSIHYHSKSIASLKGN